MKILYFVNGLNYKGGIARIVVDKVNYLAEHYGHEMTICTLNNSTTSFYPLSPKVKLIPFGGDKNEQTSILGKVCKLMATPKLLRQVITQWGGKFNSKRPDSTRYVGATFHLQTYPQNYGDTLLSCWHAVQYKRERKGVQLVLLESSRTHLQKIQSFRYSDRRRQKVLEHEECGGYQ